MRSYFQLFMDSFLSTIRMNTALLPIEGNMEIKISKILPVSPYMFHEGAESGKRVSPRMVILFTILINHGGYP